MSHSLPAQHPSDLDARLSAAIQARLDEIEQELVSAVVADTPFVTQAAEHYIAAGGKRFRPALVCCAAYVGHQPEHYDHDAAGKDRLIAAALVMELTHVASLYHDDVMDEAELRRAALSANKHYGNEIAIMVGDYLFAQASRLVSRLGVEYVQLQAETFARLVQGQIAETRGPQPGDDVIEHYLSVLSDKTASLIATSAVFGGKVAGLADAHIEALANFGEEIGMVFQLADDVIDILGDKTGKTPGTDLREHVATLPTLYLRQKNRPEDAYLIELLDADLSDDHKLQEALTLLRSNVVLSEVRDEIDRRACLARQHLSDLPAGPGKQALLALCDQSVSRTA